MLQIKRTFNYVSVNVLTPRSAENNGDRSAAMREHPGMVGYTVEPLGSLVVYHPPLAYAAGIAPRSYEQRQRLKELLSCSLAHTVCG